MESPSSNRSQRPGGWLWVLVPGALLLAAVGSIQIARIESRPVSPGYHLEMAGAIETMVTTMDEVVTLILAGPSDHPERVAAALRINQTWATLHRRIDRLVPPNSDLGWHGRNVQAATILDRVRDTCSLALTQPNDLNAQRICAASMGDAGSRLVDAAILLPE